LAACTNTRARREKNKVNRFPAWMLDVFAPYYHAYTFVLSRQNEYDADAIARDIAGA
jgi:Zn-dependent protease with chaperone function